MKRIVLHIFLSLWLIGVNQLYAQDDNYSRQKDKPEKPTEEKKAKPSDDVWDNISIGGGLGLQIGSQTYIELSPKIAYQLTKKSLVGAGFTYIYYSEDLGIRGKLKTSVYGGSIFASYEPVPSLFGWLEYELLNFEYYNNNSELKRKWLGSPFVGIGYRQSISEKGFIQFVFLYNLNYSSVSPYSSAWVPRISIFF
jgi:hypothetical protein